MSYVLLVLFAPREVEEPLHDWLLDQGIVEFTEHGVLVHGAEDRFDTALEAVRGSRARVRFEVATEGATAEALVAAARERWPHVGLYYWIVPLLERGHID